jgi:acyl carrier protein/NADP-dependent 3-hydroxy acid dehydrogenase YdfG
MAEHGAANIALLGRTPDFESPAVRAIEALGARVFALAGDVADEAAMQRLMQRLDSEAPRLRGIVHAAAEFSAAPIVELQPLQISRMLRPKIGGTLVLERLIRGRDLDFQIFFSSTTALLGASGLAHYAAANMFLDATASALDRPGRRMLSVDWGTWEAMRLASDESQRSYREGGLQPMAASVALDALGTALLGKEAHLVIASIDWALLRPLHEARRARPFLSRLGAIETAPRAATPAGPASLAERLRDAPPDARYDVIREFVSAEVTAVLSLPSDEPVPLATGLFELGMDSLMSVELRRRLERGAGCPLPSTLTFNYPTVTALARFIDGQLKASRGAVEEPARAPDMAMPLPADEDLDSLSDTELEARLLARLEQAR